MKNTVKECSVLGCSAPVVCRTFCSHHYNNWQKHGDPKIAAVHPPYNGELCAEKGCDKAAKARGFCFKHYDRRLQRGQFGAYLDRKCQVVGCHERVGKTGRNRMCELHYKQKTAKALERETNWYRENNTDFMDW